MENDNGILDIETINNELMEQRNVNTKPESSEIPNAAATMNSGNMNPLVSAPAAMEATNPAMPTAAATEAVNPAIPALVAMEATNPAMPTAATMEAVKPTMSDFSDLEIQDSSQNFDQTTMPETMDSGSHTNAETDWKRVPEGTNNYVDFADARDNYSESKPQNFFQVILAFLGSFILAGVFVLVIVKIYNIEYISKLQCLLCMFPSAGLFYGFYYMTGKSRMSVPVAILLVVLNEFISYFMFHAVMAQGVKGLYAELTYKEAWKFVDIMKQISGTKRLYYTQFASIFGVGSLSGIIFGYCGIRGIMEKGAVRGRRY